MPTLTPQPTHAAIIQAGVLVAFLCGCPGGLIDKPAAPAWGGDVASSATDAGAHGGGGDSQGDGCDLQALMALPENGCTNAGCHGAQFQGNLDLASPGLAQRLVGAVSQSEACGGAPLVDTTNLDNSLLLRMIDPARFAAAPCGVMMPLGSSNGVSSKTLACFESYVKGLASHDAMDPVDPLPDFEAVAPQSYVNKVKTLLTGQAATPAEVASVTAGGQSALTELVSNWVDTPEHASKLQDFFSVALQQRISGSLDTQFMFLRGNRLPIFRANLQESFVRTAAAIVAEGRPFSEILTTRRWAMTTASLVALAFLDTAPEAMRVERHTILSGTGTDSVANKIWYVAGVPTTCTPISPVPASQIIEMMMGFVQCREGGGYRFSDTILTDADFSDWHMVDLVPGSSAAESPIFYDVGALRGVTNVKLMQPRLGFFTTPAFLANWDTNEDNQFRVTTSQTLIVALGEILSPVDPTKPVRLDGLATDHALPGTTCYGCHQFLDPMREYFAREFSFTYQPTKTPSTITPSFAFRGETHDGGTLASFAATLAKHPYFATGWTQKLCYWANSQPCSESDPEFKRVAASFVSSKLNFKRLMIELMSSPLVTGAARTETYSEHEPFVSITRRQHLCQLLSTRLKVPDACGVATAFAGLVPEDDFSRGSAEPVQASVTGLFHFAAVEKLCLRLATKLVGNAEGVRFPISNPDAALDAFVGDMMGLGVGHPRNAAVRARLAAHYQSAASMTNPLNALRSAFTVACMSPEVMAVGL